MIVGDGEAPSYRQGQGDGTGSLRRGNISWVVVVRACNPSTLGGRGRHISELKASLVYRVSSRTARATQRNPVLKTSKSNPPLKKRRGDIERGFIRNVNIENIKKEEQ